MIGLIVGLVLLAMGFAMFICGGICNATGGEATGYYFDISAALGAVGTIVAVISIFFIR